MRKWIVRFVSLYVFDVAVLLLIGWLLPGVRVGWAALWAGVVLTAATLWLKPLVRAVFRSIAAKRADRRTKLGEKLVQLFVVFLVELVIWVLVVLLTSISVNGFFWWWLLPPIALLVAWVIYDAIDDRIEARTDALYDKIGGGRATADAGSPAPPSAAGAAGERELKDGLTDEQRRMLDGL